MKPSTGPSATPHHGASAPSSPLLSALQACMRTPEVREALGLLIPEALHLWAGDSALKQKVTRPVARHIESGFRQPGPEEDERQAGLIDRIPELVDGVLASLVTATQALETLGPEEKRKALEALVASWDPARSGLLLTRLARALNEVHATHPTALTAAIAPAVRAWVASTDFGVLREAADTMGPEVQALAEDINATLWQYPAKLVLSLSFLPDLVNLAAICLNATLRRFNQASPDLVADIALSLVRSIDGAMLGTVLNELGEVIRKVHTGSALIGEPGRPRFSEDMRQLAGAAAARLDAETYWQARVALAEDKATLAESLHDALADNPAFAAGGLKTYAARRNPGRRVTRQGLEAMDDLPDDTLGDALDTGLSDLDLQELGDIANLVTALVNRVLDLKPELVPSLVQQLADTLDVDALATSAEGLAGASATTLRPVLRALLPDLLTLLCDALAPEDDPFEDKMAAARQRLRALLVGPEDTP